MSYPIEFLYGPEQLWGWQRNDYMRAGLKVIAEPVVEQITVDQAAQHLRLDAYGSPAEYADATWLTEVGIPAARELCESLSGRVLAPKILELSMNFFPYGYGGYYLHNGIQLLAGPVVGVTSISYLDSSGTSVDIIDYQADVYSDPAIVFPAVNGSWPTAQIAANAVKIRFHAGYNLLGDSPQDYPLPRRYRAAMLLALGHLYENRENSSVTSISEIPMGITSLLEEGRIRLSMA